MYLRTCIYKVFTTVLKYWLVFIIHNYKTIPFKNEIKAIKLGRKIGK